MTLLKLAGRRTFKSLRRHHNYRLFFAGQITSVCGTYVGGQHPDTGRHFTIVEPQVGGWGASPDRDGNNALFSGSATD